MAYWRKDLVSFRRAYLREVLILAFGLGSAIVLIVLLAVGGVSNWQGRTAAVQNAYTAFGGQSTYEFAERLMRRADNVDRFIKCESENNPKCTVWLQSPPPN